jgi:hypothetical protein
MWLDRLIVVDDEISSSFSLDDEGNNAIIGGRHHFVVVECGWLYLAAQCAKLCVLQSEGEPALLTRTIITEIVLVHYSVAKNVGVIE